MNSSIILKERLLHTWDLFFTRFGRFTEIQVRAIEPLLDGKNCILVSPTSSGKTEAALVPLLERHKQNPQSGLSILYIVPTRALTRDLARRLAKPLSELGVRMRVKTGDEPGLNAGHPPELLLTTPESFDSLLVNMPRMARDIRAVVLDEVHLYDNTVRGDQLRILLNRLRRIKSYALSQRDIKSTEIQFCALSATVSDPVRLAERYFLDPVVIETGKRRELDAELLPMEDPASFINLLDDLARRGYRKVLAFCNRRSECEQLAHLTRYSDSRFGDRVFVHHASLHAGTRRTTEKNFSMAGSAICYSTSTLELGIDIGNVDLVLLVGPPASTSDFLQRIGRGNRRNSRQSVVCLYRTPLEQKIFKVLIQKAGAGEIEADPYFFRPSVVVQQLCSYIKQVQFGELELGKAYELFRSPRGEPLIERAQFNSIVEHMILKKYFMPTDRALLRPDMKWKDMYERQAIYTNLSDPKRDLVDLIDDATGRRLGQIGWGAKPGSSLLFGGQLHRIVRTVGRKIVVQPSMEERGTNSPDFRQAWPPLAYRLARTIAGEYGLPQLDAASEIVTALEEVEVEPVGGVEMSGKHTGRSLVFHCAGEAYGLVFGDLLATFRGVKMEGCNWLYLILNEPLSLVEAIRFSPEQVRAQVRRRWKQFENWFELGRFQDQLPIDVRVASVVDAFNIEEFLFAFSGRRLIGREKPQRHKDTKIL